LDPVSHRFRYRLIWVQSARRPPKRGAADINNRAIFITLFAAFIPYTAYVYTQGTEASHFSPISNEARHGLQLFQAHNCVACHQFYGLGGYMGPDLTNVISSKGAAYARAFLMSGTQRMPNFNLNESELDAVVAYLEFVDASGRYPIAEYEVDWYGTVVQNDE
jgi:nitric oxide reductase subunit C